MDERKPGECTNAEWIDLIQALMGEGVAVEEMKRLGISGFYKVTRLPGGGTDDAFEVIAQVTVPV